ncbi:MAG: CoA-transferase [Chloroflexia bacterium]
MSDGYKANLRPGSDPLVFFGKNDEAGGIARGHVMAAAISHYLQDGETVFIGANPLIPIAGARLAQMTHAPNVNIVAGASGGLNPLLEPLAPSSGDYANLVAEGVMPFDEVIMLVMGGRADVFFAGGIQIDQRGNCNLVSVGKRDKPILRGPGSAGVPWGARAKRTIVYTAAHTKRVFVPEVDFMSLAGWPAEANKNRRGPVLVITPLAVLDFEDGGNMRLVSTHSGVTLEEVMDNTGFDVVVAEAGVPITAHPNTQEMIAMRGFDLDGLLAIVV